MTRPASLVLAAWTVGLLPASTASGQDDLGAVLAVRQEAVPKGRHAFQETWLLPEPGAAAGSPNRFGGRVNVYQDGPRERLEIRRVEGDLLGDPADLPSDLVVAGQHLVRREQGLTDEQRRGDEQRITRQVSLDLGLRAVGDLGVRARVSEEPDDVQVQHRGPTLRADPLRRRDRRVVDLHRVAAVGGDVTDAG